MEKRASRSTITTIGTDIVRENDEGKENVHRRETLYELPSENENEKVGYRNVRSGAFKKKPAPIPSHWFEKSKTSGGGAPGEYEGGLAEGEFGDQSGSGRPMSGNWI